MSLANKSYSAGRWTTISTVLRSTLQLLQVVILARFLSPADYGLMAMVIVVISYALLFSDMGLSTAFVQRQSISQEERSSLYWLSVLIGTMLMFGVIAISPLIAMFFNESRLITLINLVAMNFLVTSLGQQLRMNAEKALDFRLIAFIEISAASIGFVVAIITAWLEWGVYSLVTALITSTWVTTILSWLVLAQGWRPLWRMRWEEVRWFVHFGGAMLLNNVATHMHATIDLLIGGRILGASQLGLYSVPRNMIFQVQGMVNPIFTRVSFPLIASTQHDKERVKNVYLKTMNMTASVNAPIYIAIAVFAPEFVWLLFGPSWSEAAPLMRVLALWGLLRSFGNPVGSLLFGMGYVRLAAKWNAGLLLVIPPVVWLGARWDSIGMAWAMAGLMAFLFLPMWAFLVRPVCGAGLLEYASEVFKPVICAVIAAIPALFILNVFSNQFVATIIGLLVGASFYIGACSLINKNFLLAAHKFINS